MKRQPDRLDHWLAHWAGPLAFVAFWAMAVAAQLGYAYPLVGPLDKSLVKPGYGVPSDADASKDVDLKAFDAVVLFGPDATSYEADLKQQGVNVVGTFEPPNAMPAANALAKYHGISGFIALPGKYDVTNPPTFITQGKTGSVYILGLPGHKRPLWRGSKNMRFAGLEHVEVRHLGLHGISIATNARNGSLTVDGVFAAFSKPDTVKVGFDTPESLEWVRANQGPDSAMQVDQLGYRVITIRNSELWGNGDGNTRHAIYASCAECTLIIHDSTIYASKESLLIKSVSQRRALYNLLLSGAWKWDLETLRDKYVSTSLIDLAACGDTLITNVLGYAAVGDIPRAEKFPNGKPKRKTIRTDALVFRGRRTPDVKGCGYPMPYDSKEFHDVSIWDAWASHPDLNNLGKAYDQATLRPYRFWHVIDNVELHRIDLEQFGGRNYRIAAIINDGTFPRVPHGALENPLAKFHPCSSYLPVPQNWYERSVVVVGKYRLGAGSADWDSPFNGMRAECQINSEGKRVSAPLLPEREFRVMDGISLPQNFIDHLVAQ